MYINRHSLNKIVLNTSNQLLYDFYFSIDAMSELMRNGIENKQKLNQELVLSQEDFLLNEVSVNDIIDVEFIECYSNIIYLKKRIV